MSQSVVNFSNDLLTIQRYLASRVQAQSALKKSVTGIEVGFQLNQAGLLVLHFETTLSYRPQGNYTLALGKYALELEHWQHAYESACENGVSFMLLGGGRAIVD